MSKRKEQNGKGRNSNASEPVVPCEEKVPAEKGCIGLDRPKQLQNGKGRNSNASEPVVPCEEKVPAEKGCIGLDRPKQLQNKMSLQNIMLFGLR